MRRGLLSAAAACGMLVLSTDAAAQTGGSQIQGFGGMTFGNNTTSASTFGGSVAFPLTDNIQIIGEAGRLSDLKSSYLDLVTDLTPLDFRLSAWYGEGGVRFIASPRSAIRPYAEATAGYARLTAGMKGAGTFVGIANTGLAFLNSNEPMLGVGAGVMFQGGPLLVDAGYRYKKISAGNGIASALTLSGDAIDVNQFRVGVGFRF
jgi:opacity protein-like surface antigen